MEAVCFTDLKSIQRLPRSLKIQIIAIIFVNAGLSTG